MCGIAGIMTLDGRPPAKRALDAMSKALTHRGPDGHGRHIDGNVGLVHTRLAIIDLEHGNQPFIDEDTGCTLVANGEIYNDLTLRQEMSDVRFATNSDCESPLHLYMRMGQSFADRLRGMYAIAIHDPKERCLILSRDPFGIKPLYYIECERGLAFASEPQALQATEWLEPEENEHARAELLQLQFTTGRESVLAGIQRVLPGETLIVKHGRVIQRDRRPALPTKGPVTLDTATALDQLDTVLMESVDLHQRSDVPYGMFLSGGVDSSALLAMMSRLNERPVMAFTAGFPDTMAHDEREHARAVAHAVGADHMEVPFTEQDFWDLLPEVASAMDDPAADYAILPTYKLAREAQRSVKVVLSGEGGDELFAGYGRYRHAQRPWPLRKKMRRKGALNKLGVLRKPHKGWRKGYNKVEKAAFLSGLSPLQVAQAIDCADWLPNDLLTKLDRCLMAHGLEGRVPFLDPLVADFAYRLPDSLKVRKKTGKWLLRKWLETALPASKPFAPKKGFTVPVGEWIASRSQDLGPLLARQDCIDHLCKPRKVESLVQSAAESKQAGFAAWTLLFYALWHKRHILGEIPEGNVFDVLGNK